MRAFGTKLNWMYVLAVAVALCCGPAVVTLYAQCSGCDCMKACGDGSTANYGTRTSSCTFGSGSTPCYWRDCSGTKTCWAWVNGTLTIVARCGPIDPPRGDC